MSINPEKHSFGDMFIGDESFTNFDIWNSGTGTLEYSIFEECSWIGSVSPINGSSQGEKDNISISVVTAELSPGFYSYKVIIDSNAGEKTFEISLNVMEKGCSLHIYILPDNSGKTIPSAGITHIYDYGDTVDLEAKPKNDWSFSRWIGKVSDPYQTQTKITMDEDQYVTARFTTDKNMNSNISADFTWYDKDGLNEDMDICFDPSLSSSDVRINKYSWDFNYDGEFDSIKYSPSKVTHEYSDSSPYYVMLKIEDGYKNSDVCVKKVQANKIIASSSDIANEEIDLSNKNLKDSNFDKDIDKYFTKYTKISNDSTYYMYQVKYKNNPNINILDIEKISNFENYINDNYVSIKDQLGLTDYYNFQVKIIGENNNIISSCGAAVDENSLKRTMKKDVMIYYPPEVSINLGKPFIQSTPRYVSGYIAVSVFIGGNTPS